MKLNFVFALLAATVSVEAAAITAAQLPQVFKNPGAFAPKFVEQNYDLTYTLPRNNYFWDGDVVVTVYIKDPRQRSLSMRTSDIKKFPGEKTLIAEFAMKDVAYDKTSIYKMNSGPYMGNILVVQSDAFNDGWITVQTPNFEKISADFRSKDQEYTNPVAYPVYEYLKSRSKFCMMPTVICKK